MLEKGFESPPLFKPKKIFNQSDKIEDLYL